MLKKCLRHERRNNLCIPFVAGWLIQLVVRRRSVGLSKFTERAGSNTLPCFCWSICSFFLQVLTFTSCLGQNLTSGIFHAVCSRQGKTSKRRMKHKSFTPADANNAAGVRDCREQGVGISCWSEGRNCLKGCFFSSCPKTANSHGLFSHTTYITIYS